MKSSNLKKLLAVSLASACVLSFAGCSNGSSTSEGKNSSSSSKADSSQTASSSKAASSKESNEKVKYIGYGNVNFPVQKGYSAREGTTGAMFDDADMHRFMFVNSYGECDDVEKAYETAKKDVTRSYYSFFRTHCDELTIEKQEHYKNKKGLDILKVRGISKGAIDGSEETYYGFYTLIKDKHGKNIIVCCIGIPICTGGDAELTKAVDYIADGVKQEEDSDEYYNAMTDS